MTTGKQTNLILLDFSQHVNRTTSNASKSLGNLKGNIKTKYSGIREAAYKTVARPQLEYASRVWSLYTKKTLTRWKCFKGEQLDGP